MLTARQRATYELIKKNSLSGRTTTQREIYENYPISEYERGYKRSDNPYSHDHCSQIRSDIVVINFSEEVKEIIVVDNFTYEIARNSLQATNFAKRYKHSALLKFARYGAVMRKIKANGTGELTEIENEIKFIDTFLQEKGV